MCNHSISCLLECSKCLTEFSSLCNGSLGVLAALAEANGPLSGFSCWVLRIFFPPVSHFTVVYTHSTLVTSPDHDTIPTETQQLNKNLSLRIAHLEYKAYLFWDNLAGLNLLITFRLKRPFLGWDVK